ncbi:MAG: copper resistance protein CopC [Hyphomicrobium sp.]|nr:copper resistance protein CopC [Hyphomicrobium sp.]
MQAARELWLTLLLVLAMCVGASDPARAHAALIASIPEDGAVLSGAPAKLSLSFNENVSPLVVALIRPDGTRSALDRVTARERALDIAVPGDLSAGTHILSWRVVSADGHPMAGTIVFSIGAPSATPPSIETAADWTLRSAILAAKIALYLGLFIGIGGVFAWVWLGSARRDGRSVVVPALALGIAGALLSIGLQGLDALGAPVHRIVEGAFWKAGASTTLVHTALVAALSMALSLIALVVPTVMARLLSIIALMGAGLSLSLSGHAAAAEPQWLMRSMVFAHTTGVAYWVGALVPLAAALGSGRADAQSMLGRFSRSIPWVLLVLVAGGIALTVVQVETPEALIETNYGWLLSTKLVLVAALFGLAAVNRWRLTPAVERGLLRPRLKMVRFIIIEAVCVALILAVVAGWRFTPPPRALSIAAAQPVSVHIHTLPAMAELTLSPGRKGRISAIITIMTGEYGPLDADAITLTLSPPEAGIAAIQQAALKRGDGTWRIERMELPIAGSWSVELDIRVKDNAPILLKSALSVRP